MVNKPKYIVVHCSDTSEKKLFNQLSSIDSYHKSQTFPKGSLGHYVGYHYLVTGNKLYQCRLDTDEGAHCNQVVGGKSMNVQSLGICWGGDGDIEYPNPTHYALLKAKIQELQDKYKIPNDKVLYHRHFNKSKTCPGVLLTDDYLKAILRRDNSDLMAQISTLQKLVDSLKRLLSLRV